MLLDPITHATSEFFDRLGAVSPEQIEGMARKNKTLTAEFNALAPMDKGSDATSHTKDVYEAAWGKAFTTVQAKLERKQPFASIVLDLNSRLNMTMGGQNTRVSAKLVRTILEAGNVQSNASNIPYFRVGVANGRYTLVPNVDPLEMIRAHITPAVKYVVELGSGRGNNLFMLHMMLGRATVRKIYFALEYTDSGQELTASVAQLDKRLALRTHHFDYMAPDLSMIPDDAPALFFSVHSIEQVADISPSLYDQLLARKSPTTILHFEPVGWQRFPLLVERRQAKDETFLKALIAHRTNDIFSEACQVSNAAIHSWRNGYNTNLLQILKGLVKQNRIEIAEAAFDFSIHHPCNPTTYLKLTPVAGGSSEALL